MYVYRHNEGVYNTCMRIPYIRYRVYGTILLTICSIFNNNCIICVRFGERFVLLTKYLLCDVPIVSNVNEACLDTQ